MTGSVGGYVAQVDRVLGAGDSLFPASGGPGGVDGGGGPQVPGPPPGAQLSSGAGGAGEDYGRRSDGVAGLDDQTNGAAGEGAAQGHQGRAGASGVRQGARAQAAAIAPATGSPAGMKLLVSTMDERLAAMQRQIDATEAQNRLLALRLRQLAGGTGWPARAHRRARAAAAARARPAAVGRRERPGALRSLRFRHLAESGPTRPPQGWSCQKRKNTANRWNRSPGPDRRRPQHP